MASEPACIDGGDEEVRTLDLTDANRTLYQLSYAPTSETLYDIIALVPCFVKYDLLIRQQTSSHIPLPVYWPAAYYHNIIALYDLSQAHKAPPHLLLTGTTLFITNMT